MLFLFILLASSRADAQVLYGSLVGNVTEATQAVVPGAEVTIVNDETNLTRRVLTNEAGMLIVCSVVSSAAEEPPRCCTSEARQKVTCT